MKLTRKCYDCKGDFRKEELVEYFSASGKTSTWYCPACLAARQERERFSDKVCEIFGIKSPGPRIWTERKRLRNTYGYTDDAIIDCLEYIYHVENSRKLTESLCLVTPETMERTKKWHAAQRAKASSIAAAIAQAPQKEYIVPISEHTNPKNEVDLEDGLFDD